MQIDNLGTVAIRAWFFSGANPHASHCMRIAYDGGFFVCRLPIDA